MIMNGGATGDTDWRGRRRRGYSSCPICPHHLDLFGHALFMAPLPLCIAAMSSTTTLTQRGKDHRRLGRGRRQRQRRRRGWLLISRTACCWHHNRLGGKRQRWLSKGSTKGRYAITVMGAGGRGGEENYPLYSLSLQLLLSTT